ncbi:MAG: TonB-dependent receptor [Spongiibacteraceae bacterium]
MRFFFYYFTLSILFVPVIASVQAQTLDEDELLLSYGDEELISIATGKAQSVVKAPAVASVITAEQIKSMGATSVDEALESIPGLHVSVSSTRFSPVYSIRGIHTDKNPQVLMLVNGVPITQVYLGDRGVNSNLPVNNVARIEVIRGPGSAVYGADAFAGVINIITKNATTSKGMEVGSRVGSFDSQEAWVLYGSSTGDWDFYFGLEASTTDGDDGRVIDADFQTIIDEGLALYSIPAASLAPGAVNTSSKRLDVRVELANTHWKFRLWNWRQESGVGPGLALALDPDGESTTSNYLFDATYSNNKPATNWDLETRVSYMEINSKSKQTLVPAGAVLPIGSDGNVDTTSSNLVAFSEGLIGNPEVFEAHSRIDVSAFYNGFEKHLTRLAAGISYSDMEGKETKNFGPGVLDPLDPALPMINGMPSVDGSLTSVGTEYLFIKDKSRTVYYMSVQDEWSLAQDWKLTYGLRVDDYSDFGLTANPRLALVWDTASNLTTKFLYGRAFRAPSFAELFAINNPVVLGNDELKPEIINTYEMVFDYRPHFDIHASLNIFYYSIDDLIEFAPVAGSNGLIAQNVGAQSGHGFELESEWKISKTISLEGHYAFQKSVDDSFDTDAGEAPQYSLYIHAKWAFKPNWVIGSQTYWIGGRERVNDDPRATVDNYTTTNLTLMASDLLPGIEISLSAKNIFDEDIREPSPYGAGAPQGSLVPGDFPLDGRSIVLKGSYVFK